MSNESIPIGNVIHMGLTDGTKSDPISEVAEYFIQERENDLFKIDENYVICININENELLKNLLEETQEDFRRVVKNGIIKALSGLESDIDSLNLKLDDMKKQLNSKTQKEIESLMEKTKEIATKEAESIISESKSNAEAESQKILQKGEETFTKIKKNIDTNFNSAVDDVVSSVLKP